MHMEEVFVAFAIGRLPSPCRLLTMACHSHGQGEKVCAQKRICLGGLPQTLIIQLKRFQLDYETMTNVKVRRDLTNSV